MVPRTHHFVALKATVARISTQVLVAVLAVCVLVGSLFRMIGPKLNRVILWQGTACEVGTRRISIDHALVANLASRDTHSLWCASRVLMTLGALLHLRNADVLHIIRESNLTVARLTGNTRSLSIVYVVAVGED
jgi:hypothetical protein